MQLQLVLIQLMLHFSTRIFYNINSYKLSCIECVCAAPMVIFHLATSLSERARKILVGETEMIKKKGIKAGEGNKIDSRLTSKRQLIIK